MRSDIATIIAFGLSVCTVTQAAPTYSCFDPPDEGQSNPLGEGMEDVVGDECCEALIDESDMMAGRKVIWDPVNCNHGPGDDPIAEAPLCRAHDTDGCRFCHDSCVGLEGLCITCNEVLSDIGSSSPTPSPSDFEMSAFPDTPAPASPTTATTSAGTDAPFGIFPDTPAPAASATPEPVATDAPAAAEVPTGVGSDDCECVNSMSAEEAAVLERRGKNMVCDPTCSDETDLVWGVLNCDYFALGQNCRACSNLCDDQGDGTWLDEDGFPCKPCSEV